MGLMMDRHTDELCYKTERNLISCWCSNHFRASGERSILGSNTGIMSWFKSWAIDFLGLASPEPSKPSIKSLKSV